MAKPGLFPPAALSSHNRNTDLTQNLPACPRKGHQGVLSPPTSPRITLFIWTNAEFPGEDRLSSESTSCFPSHQVSRANPAEHCACCLFNFPGPGSGDFLLLFSCNLTFSPGITCWAASAFGDSTGNPRPDPSPTQGPPKSNSLNKETRSFLFVSRWSWSARPHFTGGEEVYYLRAALCGFRC